MNKFRILATLSAMTLSPVLYADIEVWARDRNGATTPVQIAGAVGSGNHVTIAPAALSAATGNSSGTEYIVWVFDADATTSDLDESIGSITIDANSGVFGIMRLIVAPAPLTDATRSQADFNPNATDAMLYPGAVDVGPITVTPSSYENAVAVSIAVRGDVGSSTASPRDQITVGQVYRLQANGRNVSGTLVGGNIYADITAKTYSTQPYGSLAIGEITAAKSIHGKVEAPGFFDTQERRADIDTIRVTMAEASDPGITSDIKAERGEIKSIITTGKIGTSSTVRSAIRAGHGIFQIKAVDGSDVAIDRDFFADIRSNLWGIIDDDARVYRALNFLKTAGDFVGSIDTDFIRPPTDFDNGPDWGVFVGGSFSGDIRVRHSVLKACIGAAKFEGDIVIDHALDGAIVAWAADGLIEHLSVGRNPVTTNTRPGFVGTRSDPQSYPFVPWTDAPPARRGVMPADPGQPDCIVAAPYIGSITMSGMFRADKNFSPRIEAGEIGSLIIDDMREGVVWTGNIEYSLDGSGNIQFDGNDRPILEEVQDSSDDYTVIGSLELGCVSPGADVWFMQTPLATVSGHLLGELRLPTLASSASIRIGERLGTGTGTGADPCSCPALLLSQDCELPDAGWPTTAEPPANDNSPRNIGIAAAGAIRIAEEMGLKGQIVINGSNLETEPVDAWTGVVVVGEEATTPIVLAPGSASPHTAPYYETSSAMLGGGAVGLVPFRIHEVDCEPPHRVRENPTNPGLVANTNFISVEAFASIGDAPCKVRFYGPVMIDGGVDPTVIECASEDETAVCGRPWQPAAGLFTVNGPSGGATGIASRTMSLSRRSTAPTVHVGKYRVGVRPVHATGVAPAGTAAEYWRVCTDGLDEEESEAFFFRVAEGSAVDCQTCPADFNCSTMITVQDIFDFLAAWFSNDPSADVNQSGTITIQDIFDFLGLWFGGC